MELKMTVGSAITFAPKNVKKIKNKLKKDEKWIIQNGKMKRIKLDQKPDSGQKISK